MTDENMNIRAVFDGTVSRIFFIKGEGKAILLNHGEYFTVYSGLKEVSVKVGDKMLAKEKIGIVFTQEVEEKTEFNVMLDEVPADKKIAVLKVVRSLSGLGLKEAKE